MIATIRRTFLFITISAIRAFSLFLVISQSGAGGGLLPGVSFFS